MERAAGERPPHNEGRDALLDATERVIARHGFRGLTYRRVAAEAGLTHGLVTYHFGTLDALVQAALERASRHAVQAARVESDSERLEDFAADLPRLAAEEPDAQAFQFELALEARRRPELRDGVRARYEEFFAVTGQALGRLGIEPDPVLARLVFAALDGIMLQELIFDDDDDDAGGGGEALVRELQRVLSLLARAGS
jgi:AcrR family transcriptional regulator